MNKPYLYYILFITLALASCTQDKTQNEDEALHKNKNVVTPPPLPDYYLTSKETQRHVVFQFETKRDSALFDEHVKRADLSKDEIVAIESLIAIEVIRCNKTAYKPVKQPEKYFKQLIPVINSKGEKEVWVDCFCSVTPGWKEYREHVNDGGSCFLHFKINLTKGKVLKFFTNGLA